MLRVSMAKVASLVRGSIVRGSRDAVADRVCIDSRTASPGTLFFGFPGREYDGADFLQDAADHGATGAVVQRVPQKGVKTPDFALIHVPDVTQALGDLALWNASRLDAVRIGITGSTGKTTVKDALVAALGAADDVVSTQGNQNNEIGLPLTILRASERTQWIVAEMGMRGTGQIRYLTEILRPQIGVLTSINDTHIGLLKTRRMIAAAKSEIMERIPPEGTLIVNSDDDEVLREAERFRGKLLRAGFGPEADFRVLEPVAEMADGIGFSLRHLASVYEVQTVLPGRHNALNAALAVAAAYAAGVHPSIAISRLAGIARTPMRLSVGKMYCDGILIDDSYNASPVSFAAALDVLKKRRTRGRLVLVIGSMMELGDLSEAAHSELGEKIASMHPDQVLTVGEQAALAGAVCERHGIAVEYFENSRDAAQRVRSVVEEGDTVLVKGSRAMEMETVVRALQSGGEPNVS